MSKLQQAVDIVKNNFFSTKYVWEAIFYEDYDEDNKDFTVVYIDGRMVDESDLQVVVEVNTPDYGKVLVGCDGVYSSWSETSFGDPYLTKPEQVTITVYKPIKE